jgi:hypothetical protein
MDARRWWGDGVCRERIVLSGYDSGDGTEIPPLTPTAFRCWWWRTSGPPPPSLLPPRRRWPRPASAATCDVEGDLADFIERAR